MINGAISGGQVVVMAKEPVPGKVKTRLTPPFTADQAAAIAMASLADTVDAITSAPVVRGVIALAGEPGPWLPATMDVIPQRGSGLDERLAAAADDAHAELAEPVMLVGMDTPQITAELLAGAVEALTRHDAVLGPATDGGYWLLGLRRPDPGLLHGVPMSTPGTGRAQLDRLRSAGLSVGMLPELRDVDTPEDAHAVAAGMTGGRFPEVLRQIAAGDRFIPLDPRRA